MESNKRFKLIIFSLGAIAILVIFSNLIVYNKLKTDFSGQMLALGQKTDKIGDDLAKEKEYSAKQLSLLENKTIDNFRKLEQALDIETSKLRLDLETVKTETESGFEGITQKVGGLEEKSQKLEEKSQELEDKISDIDVTSSDFSSIVEDVVKAVVSIKTNKGQGSGVIFDSRGYVLTNKHVIEGVTSAQVIDYDSNTYSISIVGAASNVDLAVIKISSDKTFDYLDFADASSIKVGERVIAVGNPLGLSFSVTEGIISALNRVIDDTGVPYIQTDVPINAGNSGGPLVNSDKKIVGINTLKIVDTEGIGFAIPSNVAENIAEQATG